MITSDLSAATQALNSNDIIAMPTETVYGLAGNALEPLAIEKIYALKQRPAHNPLIVHLRSTEAITEVAAEIPETAWKLAEHFWPGPLTIVLKKKDAVPDIVTAGKPTVAVRVPNHPVALDLLAQLDFPLAAPSANPFASISPTSAEHVEKYFGEQLEVILDGGECIRGLESTIIGFEGETPIVYRLGALSLEQIENIVGSVRTMTDNETAPEAPGMLGRHYAPETDIIVSDNIAQALAANAGKSVGLMLFRDDTPGSGFTHAEVLSSSGDLEEAASRFYAALHRLDSLDIDLIVAEKMPENGLGKTMNDKLRRATHKDH
ncbi:MAG: threonylcarbamoyl-AMP synthase [Gammaproteobacteria bacterium]|jgi:L-threonylcarbamoyladenylate synthase|nr:threonylcarbamoyl-AMP synthase [Gammaproteobacteria bacterium]